MAFPLVVLYCVNLCTGFDATLTANLQSFPKWRAGWLLFLCITFSRADKDDSLQTWELQRRHNSA